MSRRGIIATELRKARQNQAEQNAGELRSYWKGPTTWVIPDATESRPIPGAGLFDLADLTTRELRLAVELGVVPYDTLPRAQVKRYLADHAPTNVLLTEMPSLMKKLAESTASFTLDAV